MSEAHLPGKTRKTRRDPERTRRAILEVAGKLLASDGPEGLSVSQVAQLAGINRGTAYHHFRTREELLKATRAWISESLCREVFGATSVDEANLLGLNPRQVTDNVTNFAMEHPEFGQAWLFDILTAEDPASDPFWSLYKAHIDTFAQSGLAEPGIDAEVHTIQMLAGVFLWPVWARARSKDADDRHRMAKRYADESLRNALHGTMREEKFPDLGLGKASDGVAAAGDKLGNKLKTD